MPKFNVRETFQGTDVFDVYDTETGHIAIVNGTWLGAIPYDDADDAADLLNVIYAKLNGLLN